MTFADPILAAFITSILAIVKATVNRVTDTVENENTSFNITVDSIIEVTPIVSAFLVAIIK